MPTDDLARARRVCLITGAGGRLGADFCARFAADYDIVAVCRRRRPDVRSQEMWHVDPLTGRTDEKEPAIFLITADLTTEGAAERVVDLTLARCGRIDLLVNAAAFVQRERLTTLADSSAFLDEAFRTNATIPIRLAAIVAREFWCAAGDNRQHNRNVVNISSGAGLGVVDAPGLSAYSASKVALNFLTCHLAGELGGIGVRVNALAPTSFPELVATSSVSDQIVAVDRAEFTGHVVTLT